MFASFGVSSTETPASPPPQPRPKRAQVARACDWCRIARVKCDAVRPCRACKQAGRECANAKLDEFRGVATATREVQRLRARVQELEAKLLIGPPRLIGPRDSRAARWKGVRIGEVHYGPSSLQYFISRLEAFTHLELAAHCLVKSIPLANGLGRPQQDYFLDLFWQGYHVVFPVIDEAVFRQHYDSLWDGPVRENSPLVDIVLALCIESYMSSDGSPGHKQSPGDEYFQRAHVALSCVADEGSTLMAVQCYFFSVIYLLAKGRVDCAAIMMGTALQMATVIGLHEPGDQHSMRFGFWLCMKTVDAQLSMHLGRPLATMHTGGNDMASYSDEEAHILGPSYHCPGQINWLSFQLHHRQLTDLVHETQAQFYASCAEVMEETDCGFYSHPATREKCAAVLAEQMKKIKDWVAALPSDLKTPRRGGVAFSNDRSPMDVQEAPLWLQRQRIILELEYHNACMLLHRAFICFLPTPALGTLGSDNHCISCVNHAVTVTNILHQLLSETDIIKGWYQLLDWQRNAMFAAAGFACGYPVCPPTSSARKALETSAGVFEMLGAHPMADMARQLDDKAGAIIAAFRSGLGLSTHTPSLTSTASGVFTSPETTPADMDLWLGEDPSESLLWGDLIKHMDPVDWERPFL